MGSKHRWPVDFAALRSTGKRPYVNTLGFKGHAARLEAI
jgi:hypothetical protein